MKHLVSFPSAERLHLGFILGKSGSPMLARNLQKWLEIVVFVCFVRHVAFVPMMGRKLWTRIPVAIPMFVSAPRHPFYRKIRGKTWSKKSLLCFHQQIHPSPQLTLRAGKYGDAFLQAESQIDELFHAQHHIISKAAVNTLKYVENSWRYSKMGVASPKCCGFEIWSRKGMSAFKLQNFAEKLMMKSNGFSSTPKINCMSIQPVVSRECVPFQPILQENHLNQRAGVSHHFTFGSVWK